MKDANLVRAQKVSTSLRGGILTLLACSAFACTPVSVDPIGVGGSGSGGSSGAVGQGGAGGSNLGNGGNAGIAGIGGTGATGGVGGSSGTGGTSNGTGGTGGTALLPDAGDPGPINLIANSDFEQGLSPWTMIAQAGTIMLSTDCNGPTDPDAGVADAGESDAGEPERPHGLQCGRGTGRTLAFHGPAYPLNGILTTRGKTYTVSAYGRIAGASSSVMKLTMRTICQGHDGVGLPPLYANLAMETPVTDREWIFLSNLFTVPDTGVCPVMNDIRLYLEGPPADIDILVDDVSIYEL